MEKALNYIKKDELNKILVIKVIKMRKELKVRLLKDKEIKKECKGKIFKNSGWRRIYMFVLFRNCSRYYRASKSSWLLAEEIKSIPEEAISGLAVEIPQL